MADAEEQKLKQAVTQGDVDALEKLYGLQRRKGTLTKLDHIRNYLASSSKWEHEEVDDRWSGDSVHNPFDTYGPHQVSYLIASVKEVDTLDGLHQLLQDLQEDLDHLGIHRVNKLAGGRGSQDDFYLPGNLYFREPIGTSNLSSVHLFYDPHIVKHLPENRIDKMETKELERSITIAVLPTVSILREILTGCAKVRKYQHHYALYELRLLEGKWHTEHEPM